jgi:hypothetical protein
VSRDISSSIDSKYIDQRALTQNMHVCTHCGSIVAAGDLSAPPTIVSKLIGTNAVPSPSEESTIREWLLDMNSDLSQLNGEIDRVQAILDDLRRKRQVLSDTRPQHKGLLSLIRRMPPELLSEIFILSLPEDWEKGIYDFRRAVMLPGSVCKHWRDIALSTPRLWNLISSKLRKTTVPSEVDFVRTWISRSGELPLCIRLHGGWLDDSEYMESSAANSITDAVAEYAERWEHAEFAMTHSMNLFRSAKNRLLHLHTLVIDFSYGPTPSSMASIDIFEVAPQLTSITFRCNALHHFIIPWTQLTIIRMSAKLTLDECHEMLLRALNLVECHLRVSGEQLDPSRAICHLAHLRILHIEVDDPDFDPGNLFEHLSLPALHSFHYKDEHLDSELTWPQAQFVSLLSRSSCSVKKFSLSFPSGSLQNDDLMECLRLMPLLLHLTLDASFITNEALALLSLSYSTDSQANCLVPKLNCLKLRPHWMSHEALADMIISRRRFNYRLQCCDIQLAHILLLTDWNLFEKFMFPKIYGVHQHSQYFVIV